MQRPPLTRRETLTLLALGTLGVAAGCFGGSSHAILNVTPERLVIPADGSGALTATSPQGSAQITGYGPLPSGVRTETIDAENLFADATAPPSRTRVAVYGTVRSDNGGSAAQGESSIELIVVPAGHGIALTVDTLPTLTVGTAATVKVKITPTMNFHGDTSGFTGAVTLRVDGLPTGATATFSPGNVVTVASETEGQVTLAITMPTAAAGQTFSLSVVGIHGAGNREATAPVTATVSGTVPPSTTGIDFVSVTAAIPATHMETTGTYYDRSANERSADYGISTAVLRAFSLTITDDSGLKAGKTYAPAAAPIHDGCEIAFVYQGGVPYFQSWKAQVGVGGVTLETIDDKTIRARIVDRLHFVPVVDATGTFDITGSFVLRKLE